MVTWIDAKNPSLYKGGISSWLDSIILSLDPAKTSELKVIRPNIVGSSRSKYLEYESIFLPWFSKLPRKVNHLIYDLITFRFYAWLKNPQVVFSPYYDVIMPKKGFSIIAIHDLCFMEVPELYPYFVRKYYIRALKTNLRRTDLILTVSQNSRLQISKLLNIPTSKILIIKNQLSEEFVNFRVTTNEIDSFRRDFEPDAKLILYTGGFENRKNIDNLFLALEDLVSGGIKCVLIITGEVSEKWNKRIENNPILKSSIKLVGFLSTPNLKIAYESTDVVVYPSRSEGFGRSCIESMYTNTPLACSNLPVFKEVAGDYAEYFDPLNFKDIAEKIKSAMKQRKNSAVVLNKYMDESDDFAKLQLILQNDYA